MIGALTMLPEGKRLLDGNLRRRAAYPFALRNVSTDGGTVHTLLRQSRVPPTVAVQTGWFLRILNLDRRKR
jgi:hypothetical protein